jgi:hypothetical protein
VFFWRFEEHDPQAVFFAKGPLLFPAVYVQVLGQNHAVFFGYLRDPILIQRPLPENIHEVKHLDVFRPPRLQKGQTLSEFGRTILVEVDFHAAWRRLKAMQSSTASAEIP